ncbi:MAG: tetratricopeptide repeat protein [Terriglobia bacterium]
MFRLSVGLALSLALVATALPVKVYEAQTGNRAADTSGDWPFQPPSAAKSVEVGNFYLRRGDFRGALSRYQEAIRTDSDYAPAYLGLGKAYEAEGKRRQALAAYEKYLAALPSDRDAARAKGAHKAIARLKREIAKPKNGAK